MVKNKLENKKIKQVIILITIIFIGVLSFTIYYNNYIKRKLYEESINQLDELSEQMFEKMEVQINIQWGYLDKFKEKIKDIDSLTIDESKNIILFLEQNLAPINKNLYFRFIDEDGYYYTHEGKNGNWPGNNNLKNLDEQSFLISNWYEENYMAFTYKLDHTLKIDGKVITNIVLMRLMDDMQEFFHSSSFNNQNITYVIDDNGVILFKDGYLENVNFNGQNLFNNLSNVKFPHYKSFENVLDYVKNGATVCTDIKINGNKFYLIFNKIAQYDWDLVLLVSSNSIAVSTKQMILSFVRMSIIFTLALVTAIFATTVLINNNLKSKQMLQLQKETEKILAESNKNLQRSKLETEDALLIAKSATKAKSQFLANMSHDIRTPMNAIVGVTKLMEYEVDNPDKVRYYINKLRHSSEYMLGLINDILDMSKIEAGDVHLNIGPVKMAEQVGQIESIIRSQCNEKNQEFSVVIHDITHEYLLGDSIRLRQIFLNLLSNAVKYTPVGGKISFDIKELPCEIDGCAKFVILIVDNGYGISKEFQKNMFQPFAREENSVTNKISGTGLGLSITKNLIDLMNGTINVDSEIDKGSTFEVTLNLKIDKEKNNIINVKDVLLVSSEELLIKNVIAAFKENDVNVHIKENVKETIELLKITNIDAILLSGYLDSDTLKATVKTLKMQAKEAMFIFCCDYAHREHIREMLLSSGIDGFIARPFFLENFVLAIEQANDKDLKEEELHHSILKGMNFLCAEDNELNAEILEALLTMHGANCKIYPNGKELVEAFSDVKDGDYDAILMDMQMPIMDGVSATKEIRNGDNSLGKSIPIIAMTANAFSSDIEICINAGMDAHLAKPLNIQSLERTMHDIMNKKYSKKRKL